jgi:tRNA pseudouridine65 synthase
LSIQALNIIHMDDDIVAINKPPSLATHPGLGCPDETTCLSAVRDFIGRWVFPVHRLDRPTSGVLVFALHEGAARAIGKAFMEHRVEKEYRAIVRGYMPEEGCIGKPLTRMSTGEPQSAATAFRCLATTEAPWAAGRYTQARYSLVGLVPKTGRTHQLRRHLHSIAHPIVGDTRYGDGAHNRAFRENLGIQRLFLHALSLKIPHPRHGQLVTLIAEEDIAWQAVQTRLFATFITRTPQV